MSERCFNRMVQLMGETIPKGNIMVTNLYHARKSVEKLGLGSLKIDCFPNGCMLYYNENFDKTITKCFGPNSCVIHPMVKLESILIDFIQSLVKIIGMSDDFNPFGQYGKKLLMLVDYLIFVQSSSWDMHEEGIYVHQIQSTRLMSTYNH
ncbi:hypothetical protein CR513_60166, partial [Mucuna pruriens]